MNVEGKLAVVTGGGAGIGLAITRALRTAGADVLIVGRNGARLRAAQDTDPQIRTVAADLGDGAQRARLIDHLSNSRPPDILVNNAGTMTQIDLQGSTARAMMDDEIAVDLLAPMRLSTALLPMLLGRPESAIVNVTTGLIYAPLAANPAYSAAKAGLHAFTQALRHQTRHTPLQVLEVLPPTVDTELTHGYGGPKIAPVVVGRAVVRALITGRTELRIGQAKLLYPMSRLMPNGTFPMMNRFVTQEQT
ncbi:SDR family NAD(P)-dependent oxidoreductase [Mycobacterium sp. 4858]|uniref:SDR family NAD(P)-dependent oxidoreductase n=1 Tax=Mycobacterium sp. 4858 TaxID=2057185 RepID=UPI000C81D607|nr:SDR family NAD(P)-dependent oxidoreductase [Mycobacterium sp. 4858]